MSKENINIDNQESEDEVLNEEENSAEELTEDAIEEEVVDEKAEENEVSKEDEEDANSKYLRLMADFQNYKRRSEESKSDIYAFANEKIVSQLLDVLDNFQRALEHDTEDESFKEGIVLIYNKLKDVLIKSGVSEIEAENQEFDPNFHNAVMMEDTDDYESNRVTEVLQKGYCLNGKVIRPVMVKVAK